MDKHINTKNNKYQYYIQKKKQIELDQQKIQIQWSIFENQNLTIVIRAFFSRFLLTDLYALYSITYCVTHIKSLKIILIVITFSFFPTFIYLIFYCHYNHKQNISKNVLKY